MLIDLFYIWAEKWVKIYDEGNNCFMVIMLLTTFVLYALAGYFTWMNFIWFTDGDNCGGHTMYIVISIILAVICTVCTVLPIAEHKSIITSGAVCLYISYFTWSALVNSVNEGCNYFYKKNTTLVY